MSETPPAKIRFDLIKSPQFRVIHADGAFGGLTPGGELFFSFFSERFPIPTALVHEIDSGGRLGKELRAERETRGGIVRELEVGIRCNVETAKIFLAWLQDKVSEAEKRQKLIEEKEEKD